MDFFEKRDESAVWGGGGRAPLAGMSQVLRDPGRRRGKIGGSPEVVLGGGLVEKMSVGWCCSGGGGVSAGPAAVVVVVMLKRWFQAKSSIPMTVRYKQVRIK